jgi:acylphosphatase
VEAVVQGDEAAVAAMIAACHEGPRHGRVDFVTESAADFVAGGSFSRFPSV